MAVREIKTTLSLDGEKEFNRAISEAGRGMRVMASEMKAAAADFDVTGDEMEYLGRKSRSLNSQIEQQEQIIRALEGAVADSAQTYGEASAKTDGYRIKLNNAYASLSRLKKEHEQTDKRMEELGRDSERTGRRLEQGIGEAADDVSRKFDGMVNKLDSDLGSIKAMTSISAVVDVAGTIGGAVKGAYDGVKSLVDETADYNRSMAFLKINAEQAGISFQTVKKMAVDVSGITGDMDASIEGLSNLLASGFEADELSTAVERLSGAIIQIPDTLKFESLADGLQETIATRNAVGQYAEYLERMGLDLDTVNKSLANAGKEGQEAVESVALSFLSGHGAEEALAKYRAEKEDLIKYFEAQAKLTDAQARLGETMTPAATAGIEMVAGFVDKLTGLIVSAGEAIDKQKEKTKELQEENKEFEKSLESETKLYSTIEELKEARKKAVEAGDTLEIERLDAELLLYTESLNQKAQEYGEGTEETFTEGFKDGLTEDTSDEDVKSWWEKLFSQTMLDDTKSYGSDIAKNIGDGIESNAVYAVSKVNAMMADIQSALNRKITYPSIGLPSPTSTTSYASAGTSKTTIALDGKKLGEATVYYNNAALGQSLIRAETYG